MEYMIRRIGEISYTENKIWGNKAAYLADAAKRGFSVPDGFCIVIKRQQGKKNGSAFLKDVERYFDDLKERTGAQRFIVRSSAQYEDRKTHIFPGIYKSKRNITDFRRLINALLWCYSGFYSEFSALYMKEMDIQKKEQKYYCLIVQEQIEPDYSGVAFTRIPIAGYYEAEGYLVEMVKQHCQELLRGKVPPNTYLIEMSKGLFQSRKLAGPESVCRQAEKEILEKLGKTLKQLSEIYGQNLDVEWGFCRGEIVIYQIRAIYRKTDKLGKKPKTVPQMGLKAEAMERFYSMGLFQKKLLVIRPGQSLEEIEHKLYQAQDLRGAITVRYSCIGELGLPRYFALNKKEAIEFVRRTRRPEWAVILHESITVRHSYEMYLDEEKTILEHVPGMWETDNKEAADMWVYEGPHVVAFAAGSIRTAKYEDAWSREYRSVDSYGRMEMEQIAGEIYPYIQILGNNWPVKQGINFHFVQDDEGRFFFLNHRKTRKIPKWQDKEEKMTVIESSGDFVKWDGGSILLKINMKRGEEMLIKEYVPFLKNTGVKVYVQFGILSHPAILLREMGIQVYPEYTHHKRYEFVVQDEREKVKEI